MAAARMTWGENAISSIWEFWLTTPKELELTPKPMPTGDHRPRIHSTHINLGTCSVQAVFWEVRAQITVLRRPPEQGHSEGCVTAVGYHMYDVLPAKNLTGKP